MKPAQVVRNFITPEVAEQNAVLIEEAVLAGRSHRETGNESDCTLSHCFYGLHNDLLEDCLGVMEEITGLVLEPTYTYCRLYPHGEKLVPHKDKAECEVSVTLNLRNVGDPWTFCWTGGSIDLTPGDAVVYRGCDVRHWRDPNPTDDVYQVFMHYVDANGPHADLAYEYLKKLPTHIDPSLRTHSGK